MKQIRLIQPCTISILQHAYSILAWQNTFERMREIVAFLLLVLFIVANSFKWSGNIIQHKSNVRVHAKIIVSDESDKPSIETVDLDRWWKDSSPLISIGSAGITPKHLSSLKQLLDQHKRVKVKVATDRINIVSTANSIVESNFLRGGAHLIEIRGKCFCLSKSIN